MKGVVLQSHPGASFTVFGAPAASGAARISAGATLNMETDFGAYVAFEGTFSGMGNTYASKGGIRYAWQGTVPCRGRP